MGAPHQESNRQLESHLEARISSQMRDASGVVSLDKPFGLSQIRSAVVLPVYEREGTLYTRMTVRAESLRSFSGETVFAGGRLERFESPVQAAIREYSEEVGASLEPEQIVAQLHPIYRMRDDGTCYEISPCVAEISPDGPLNPSSTEVAQVVDVPLDPGNQLFRNVSDSLKGATRILFLALAASASEIRETMADSRSVDSRHSLPKCLITSGGTRVPIDTVRSVTNESAGTSGALIAESLMKEGSAVHYLAAKDARTPFFHELTFDFSRNQDGGEAEIERVSGNAQKIFPLMKDSTIERVKFFSEYERRLMELCRAPETDVVILAMAANDHAPEQAQGKISSDADSYAIEFKRLPKLISQVKKQREGLFLVGFKLLINREPDQLVNTAYASMLRDKQDLAVANVGIDTMRAADLKTYIVTGERGIIPVEREFLAERLKEIIQDRFSKRHFHTNVQRVESLPLEREEVDSFLQNCQWLSKLALFNPYSENAKQEFGFVAQRVEGGTLITARGSSKSEASDKDIALVTDVNLDALTLDVQTCGPKASLNASVAHLIFRIRPEVKYIVHAHISLPEAVRVARDSSPSTLEDWERIETLVQEGHTIIEQPHHGVLILMETLDEILPLLERNSIYRQNARYYDDAYRRFLSSDSILDRFEQRVPKDGKVLDLCSGTGEVTLELLERGYRAITLQDRSQPMNDVAREKLQGKINSAEIRLGDMESLESENEFDGVIIRQAINYVAPDDLTRVFRNIGNCLKPGGTLVFNSFVPESVSSKRLTSRRIQTDEAVLNTSEGNLVRGDRVYHGQRTEIFDRKDGDYHLIYDLNSFWAYSSAQFEQALREAGAKQVEIEVQGNSVYYAARWS